ncbi:MAG: response regulator [Bacteroidia bacterium]|nr:response regulator [Bacteroidia bacterium]
MRDIRIGAQLSAAFALVLFFVVVLGVLAWYHTDVVWRSLDGLYRHPFVVREAIGDLRSDILIIHRNMKDLLLTEDPARQDVLLRGIGLAEIDAEQQFDILFDRYLGHRSDIDSVRIAFELWKGIRQQTVRLLHAGRRDEAVQRTMADGVGGAHAEHMYRLLRTIQGTAQSKADYFRQRSNEQKRALTQRLVGVVLLILFLSGFLGLLLFRAIRQPVSELTTAAARFTNGDYDVRSSVKGRNELGCLSAAFNGLAEKIQREIRLRDTVQHIKHALVEEHTLHTASKTLLRSILTRTSAKSGAVYLYQEANDNYTLFESIGMPSDTPVSFSALQREDVFGLTMETKEITRISNITDDAMFLLKTPEGRLRPKEILSIPIIFDGRTHAIIAITSPTGFSDQDLGVFDQLSLFLGTYFSNIQTAERIEAYASTLEKQNQELEAQTRELCRQAEELGEQNVELALQKQELSKASAMKSTFLSNMSHELRTPLNSVIALSGVLQRRLRDSISEQECSYIEIIERNGKHLLSLINNILDLSRIEAGREVIENSDTNIAHLVRDVSDMLLPQAEAKNLRLECSVQQDLPTVVTDAAKCRQILINLVGNAIKFTDAGSVRVSACVREETMRILVSDTGIGIAPQQLEYIFDEFRQADEGVARKHDGTGLGLAISRRYATLMHASIEVESVLGQGSSFTLVLPLRSEVSADRYGTQSSTVNTVFEYASHSGAHILIVEDNEAAQLQLREILEPQGYRISTAGNGAEALRQVREIMPDGIILDLMMPEIDGFELLRLLREGAYGGTIPVLILTAKQVTREELASLKGNNIHQFIQKGDISKRELLAAVAGLVRGSESVIPAVPDDRTEPQHLSPLPTVLVIEDNSDSMVTIEALLHGVCEVKQAGDGFTGIEMAVRLKPEIILLDISLPELDGFQVLDAIRKQTHLRDTPVVAITALGTIDDQHQIIRRGFTACVEKPVDGANLIRTIMGLIHGIHQS